jgi:hypothetical protein
MSIKILNEFHITIVPYPPTPKELNINKEINLIKTAILYGDKVLLISIIPTLFYSFLNLIDQFSKDEKIKQKIIDSVELDELSKSILLNMEGKIGLKSKLENVKPEIGINKIDIAIKSGLLDIYTIGKSRIPEETYPLLDENILNLVKAERKDEKLNISDVDSEKIKQIGFVFNIFQRLPNFENATIDEILDIRKTLDKPLIRFRAAIIRLSNDIKYKPWDENFYYYIDKLFIEKINPALLEIEEECKSNRYLIKLLNIVAKSSWEIPAGLGVIISKLAEVSNISATAIGMTIGAGTVAYNALYEWKEKTKEIEKNQMFFYYKTGKMLNK